MRTSIKIQARNIIIDSIRKLKKPSAQRAWAQKLGDELYKMQKTGN